MSDNDIYVAAVSARVLVGGRRLTIQRGVTTVRAGHPLLEGRAHMFRPLVVHHDTEQATAGPGEQSNAIRSEKAELLAEAESLGLDIKPRTKVTEIRRLIDEARAQAGGE